MSKKTGPEIKSVTEAVKELRIHLGETQQSFANRLKIAISSMVRYETNRPPRGENLVTLMLLADNHGLPKVAQIFRAALAEELGHDVFLQPAFSAAVAKAVTDTLTELSDASIKAVTETLTADKAATQTSIDAANAAIAAVTDCFKASADKLAEAIIANTAFAPPARTDSAKENQKMEGK